MGMFDKPQYLTGREGGYVQPGDTFWLHNARIDGTSNIGGSGPRAQAKLKVSRERDGETCIVYTSGTAIVGQIGRMSESDRASMPMEVRLDSIAPTQAGRNATHVLTPAELPPPSPGTSGSGADDF